MKHIQKQVKLLLLLACLTAYFTIFIIHFAYADPKGADLTYVNTETFSPSPESRTDDGGNIVTLTINVEQQDDAWKGYVGNVTGVYVLKNSNNYSIYEWPAAAVITGEVYISRNSSLNFSSGAITCANAGEISAEESFFGMVSGDTDKIINTFNTTNHSAFNVGSNIIVQDSCNATALWVNDTVQTPSNTSVFQEIILHDGSTLLYASLINDNKVGFDNTTSYDFQAIVAENRTSAGTTYYFYVELGS